MKASSSEGDVNAGEARRRWTAALAPETREVLSADASAFVRQALSSPCLDVLTGAEGATLTALGGRAYLDFHGNGLHQVGYGHPQVIEAIARQMRELPFCPRRFTNAPAIALAEKLAAVAPGDLNRVLLAPGGTSAIGIALKMARLATGKFKTVSMWESFHGASLDAISIGGEAQFRAGVGPLLPGTEHAPPPDPLESPWDGLSEEEAASRSADYIEYVLEKEAGDVACVIAETARWTPYFPPPDYWRRIREACDRWGALLVLDEIPTGLGRSGKMFVCEHYGIVPDILVLGKGLGGGIFPLAATIVSDRLTLSAEHSLGHYTHEKNPVACAAALATLAVIEEEDLPGRAAVLGADTLARLSRWPESHPPVASVRGRGLLLGVVMAGERGEAAPRAERVLYRCLENGLSFKTTMGRVLSLCPPLTISEPDLDRALSILEQAIGAESENAP